MTDNKTAELIMEILWELNVKNVISITYWHGPKIRRAILKELRERK